MGLKKVQGNSNLRRIEPAAYHQGYLSFIFSIKNIWDICPESSMSKVSPTGTELGFAISAKGTKQLAQICNKKNK
jgi:hypothetical protein